MIYRKEKMNNTILNWNEVDHRAIYSRQLKENPLYYDRNLNAWVVYSYEHCKTILQHADALIPPPLIEGAFSENGKLLLKSMARLSNGGQHDTSRAAAMAVFAKIKLVSAGMILKDILDGIPTGDDFDWVDAVAKQLPVRLLLKGLDFNADDSKYVAENLKNLVSIMLPNKTDHDIQWLNPVVDIVYQVAEKYTGILRMLTGEKQTNEVVISNLIGLFIQCYDAGRGLLCNSLLNMVKYKGNKITGWNKLVDETLRHDPPVHNTRRLAATDIAIGGQTIKAGETILVVLAAANLDENVFTNPAQFDLTRGNNDQHLTFGLGGHNCLAKHLCIDMAADVCRFLEENYGHIQILQREFTYETQLNVRLVKQLMISLK